MPGRRPVQKGSFAGHFDELVTLFPEQFPEPGTGPHRERSKKLQDKIDIHRVLFERAWGLDS